MKQETTGCCPQGAPGLSNLLYAPQLGIPDLLAWTSDWRPGKTESVRTSPSLQAVSSARMTALWEPGFAGRQGSSTWAWLLLAKCDCAVLFGHHVCPLLMEMFTYTWELTWQFVIPKERCPCSKNVKQKQNKTKKFHKSKVLLKKIKFVLNLKNGSLGLYTRKGENFESKYEGIETLIFGDF